jgi:very-short-patch-repair endonuclease
MSNIKARLLRKNMTDAERRLWSILRDRHLSGWKFRRQHPVRPYILDFACLSHFIAVEVDGGQHADSETDLKRTNWLAARGWRVLRFWNNEVLANRAGVAQTIHKILLSSRPVYNRSIPSPSQP